MLNLMCPRCYRPFNDSDQVNYHLRNDIDCETRNIPDLSEEGCNEKKEKIPRKRNQGGSDEDKWKDMYRILFPGVSESDVPSPCECPNTHLLSLC